MSVAVICSDEMDFTHTDRQSDTQTYLLTCTYTRTTHSHTCTHKHTHTQKHMHTQLTYVCT